MLTANSFRSVPDMWHHRIGSTPDAEALRYREKGVWRSMTWGQAGKRVKAIATALLAEGLAPEDRCCILAETSHSWVLADLAILCSGCATTTIYPNAPDADCSFILKDSGSKVIFVDSMASATRVAAMKPELPALQRIVVFQEGQASPSALVVCLDAFQEQGAAWAAKNPEGYTEARKSVGPQSMATLMYTSGTTGHPKGVMLTHDTWIYKAEAIDALGFLTPVDVQFLFLPLSHVFAKVLEMSFIRLGIPTVVDGSIDDLMSNLNEARPTWFAAVPRIFEKARDAILHEVSLQPLPKRKAFDWALRTGRRVSAVRQQGRRPGGLLKLKMAAADRLVLRDIRERFGGGIRFMISGGAPLSREVGEFFDALGMLVLEGYGLTESGAASTVNRPGDMRLGTVGKPLPDCDIRIGDDGEILIRSRGVMKGYWGHDDETQRVLIDGWLHTGDLGVIHHSGHVQITGRKKELIVTAGGKNIAPAHFEGLLQAKCPYVSHALLHGDRRAYCVALITLDSVAIGRWARQHNVPDDPSGLHQRAEIRELIQDYVDAIHRDLPPWEHAQHIQILAEDFTLDNGMLTPSLKVKRRVVEARYADDLDQMYR